MCISSDFNNSLPKSIALQHLHEGSRHVFKANSDHFFRLQLALQGNSWMCLHTNSLSHSQAGTDCYVLHNGNYSMNFWSWAISVMIKYFILFHCFKAGSLIPKAVYLFHPFKHSLDRFFIFVSPSSHHKAFYHQLSCYYFMVRIRTYEKEIHILMLHCIACIFHILYCPLVVVMWNHLKALFSFSLNCFILILKCDIAHYSQNT